jgi:hypothetical protein
METTLGIDLASQPANTALCVIAWDVGTAEVRALARSTWNGTPLHDKLLSTAACGLWGIDGTDGWGSAGRPVKVAIDAPFGWPEPFVRAIEAHHALQPWPETLDNCRGPFERRATDRFVKKRANKVPLSVSTDRIAYPAMRCAVLLTDLARHLPPELLGRDGSGLVAEAYPDAALRMWLPAVWESTRPDSYKGSGDAARTRRESILTGMLSALGPRFGLSEHARSACVDSDDCLDALVCALLARAVDRGLTMRPDTEEHRALALTEGWIHLPDQGTLHQLV